MRLLRITILLLLAAPLSARELHWRAIDVKATLDRSGTLHVRERQAIVFDGDWNGGERRFNIRPGQEFQLVSISRETPQGEVLLRANDGLSSVDDYSMKQSVARWRSRLPNDPPFAKQEIVYILDYTISNVLRTAGSGYLLKHDFLFPDREGVVEQFTVDLDFAPEWGAAPLHRSATMVAPGRSYIVKSELRFRGQDAPAAIESPSPLSRYLTIGILLLGFPLLFLLFMRAQVRDGILPREQEPIDRVWLKRHIFSELPEVIGFMYDRKSGPPEVAATLARMEQEKRISTNLRKEPSLAAPVLEITRHGEKRSLPHETKLMKMFFVTGSSKTDTTQIKKRYEKTGFNPGQSIGPELAELAFKNEAWATEGAAVDSKKEFARLWAGYLLLVPGLFLGAESRSLMIWTAVLGSIACLLGRVIAWASSRRVDRLPLWWLAASLPLLTLGVLYSISAALADETRNHGYAPIGAALFLINAYWFVLQGARSSESDARRGVRQRIAAARAWFKKQLRSAEPELDQAWMPYLLALGLGNNVDGWFKSFGAAATASSTSSTWRESSDSSVGSSSSSASGRTAGSSIGGGWGTGSSFGGAGSTGSWAAAAGALGAGSSAPSSSSSSGGSDSSGGDSGGDSSSGGGGGGGW